MGSAAGALKKEKKQAKADEAEADEAHLQRGNSVEFNRQESEVFHGGLQLDEATRIKFRLPARDEEEQDEDKISASTGSASTEERDAASTGSASTSTSDESFICTFSPGKLGLKANWTSGVVSHVSTGGQAETLGVQVGMRFDKVGLDKYSEKLLDAARTGSTNFNVTFVVKETSGDLFRALVHQQVWGRGDPFRSLNHNWLVEGGEKAEPDEEEEDVVSRATTATLETGPSSGRIERRGTGFTVLNDEDIVGEEGDDGPGSDEDSEEENELNKQIREAREKRLEEDMAEQDRIKLLNDDPSLQGYQAWFTARHYGNTFCSRNRAEVVRERRENLRIRAMHAGIPESPKRHAARRRNGNSTIPFTAHSPVLDDMEPIWRPAREDTSVLNYDWFRVPAVSPGSGAKVPVGSPLPEEAAYCWRSDFVAEVLNFAYSSECHLPVIDLKRAQDVFERSPEFAYTLAMHSEVVSISGRRELWSQAFIQSLEVLRSSWQLSTGELNDVRLTEEILAPLLQEKDFPPLSERRLPLHRRGEVYDDDSHAFGSLREGDSVEILVGRHGSRGPPKKEWTFVRRWEPARVVSCSELATQTASFVIEATRERIELDRGVGSIRKMPQNVSHILPGARKVRSQILVRASEAGIWETEWPGPLPKVPMILPHAQFYESGGEAWANLAPPLPPGAQEEMLQPGFYFLGARSRSNNMHTTGRSFSAGSSSAAAFSIGGSRSLSTAGFMTMHPASTKSFGVASSGLESGWESGAGSLALGDRTKSALKTHVKGDKDLKVTFGGQEEKTFGLTWQGITDGI